MGTRPDDFSLVVGFNLIETHDLARAALEPAEAGGEGIVSCLVLCFILNEAYDECIDANKRCTNFVNALKPARRLSVEKSEIFRSRRT